MILRVSRWVSLVAVTAAFLMATSNPLWAAEPVSLELQAPEQVTLGDEVIVTAVLRDGNGAPVPAATVILWSAATFLSTGGAIELGRAVTNAQGKATLLYQARTEERALLNAYFPGDSRYDPASATVELMVQGSSQLYQSTAGVRVPGIGVWLLVGVLGIVWSIYLTVMVLLTLIAREGSKAPLETGGADA